MHPNQEVIKYSFSSNLMIIIYSPTRAYFAKFAINIESHQVTARNECIIA